MTLKQSTMYSPLGACELQSVLRALDESTIVAVTDASWNITYVNDRFCQVSGYSREELIGQNHRILKSGEHPTEFWVEMYQDLSFGKTWTGTVKNIAKDGSNYWVDSVFTPILGDDGNLVERLRSDMKRPYFIQRSTNSSNRISVLSSQ